MQIRIFAVTLLIIFFFSRCSDTTTQTNELAGKDPAKKQSFFPVTEYIRGQLREIDSLPVTPLKIITTKGKQDSIWMKKEDIRHFAEPFLYPEIDTSNLKSLFTEKSFLDQTINAFTFSYDPIGALPDTLQLRRWDVYIDPKKNTIKRIYIIKEVTTNGVVQTLQLSWKSDQWCKITTITEQPGKKAELKEELMKWDFTE